MNLLHPTWDAELDAGGGALLRAARLGEGEERALEPGAVVAFPAGPAAIHQVLNSSGAPARVLIC